MLFAYPWTSKLTVVWPWTVQRAGEKKRHQVGAEAGKGGQFAAKDVPVGMKHPAFGPLAAHKQMNRARSRLNKKKAQRKNAADKGLSTTDLDGKISGLNLEYQLKKAAFTSAQRIAALDGVKVNALGRWSNQKQYVEAKVRAEEAQIIGDAVETGVCLDHNGTLLFKTSAKIVDEVPLSPEHQRMMKGNIFSHNHPSCNSLSDDDVLTSISLGVTEVRAVGKSKWPSPEGDHSPRKYLYSAKPDPKWQELGEDGLDKLWSIYQGHNDQLYREWTPKVQDRTMDERTAGGEHGHTVWGRVEEQLKREGLPPLNYSRTEIK
jgi:hypothetical protein